MQKITIKIAGMACGMCEAHINDAIRKAFPIKKVSSSYRKKEAVILSETAINENKLRDLIQAGGYELIAFTSEPYEKKGFFGK